MSSLVCASAAVPTSTSAKCAQPVLPWESDFDKGPRFWKPVHARQHCQLTAVPGGALHATVDAGPAYLGIAPVAIDACLSVNA